MDRDPLTPARVRGIIMQANWNAYKVTKEGDVIITKGLYPLRRGIAIYLPFIFGGYEIWVRR